MRAVMSDDLDELRAELDDFAQPEKNGGRTPREERIIAGFEETVSNFDSSCGASTASASPRK
jgi:hypothetical protein